MSVGNTYEEGDTRQCMLEGSTPNTLLQNPAGPHDSTTAGEACLAPTTRRGLEQDLKIMRVLAKQSPIEIIAQLESPAQNRGLVSQLIFELAKTSVLDLGEHRSAHAVVIVFGE